VVTVSDGTQTKQLEIIALTIDGVNPATGVATGTGPAGVAATVDLSLPSEWVSRDVTISANGTWQAQFDPFELTADLNASVGIVDEDGDSNSDEWYPPCAQASVGLYGGGSCGGNDFTEHSRVEVSLFASDREDARLLFSATPATDGFGSWEVGFGKDQGTFGEGVESIDLVPGMKLVVHDPVSGLTKAVVVADLCANLLDPADDAISGVAPAGSTFMVYTGGDGSLDQGAWEVTAGEDGSWSMQAETADFDWSTWGTLELRDADGDATCVGAAAHIISANLVSEVIEGSAFSRLSPVDVGIYASPDAPEPIWAGTVQTDPCGRFTVGPSTHGLDLTGGMFVRAEDPAVGTAKELEFVPLTFDGVDIDAREAWGTGPEGVEVHLTVMGPDGGGEAGYPVPDADGNWRFQFDSDIGWLRSFTASVLDPESDQTIAPLGNTPAGDDTQVDLGSGASITFETVDSLGQTTLTTGDTSPDPDASTGDFQVLEGIYFNISTTATYSGPLEVALPYDPDELTLEQQQALVLLHFDAGQWVAVDSTVDTDLHLVRGLVPHLSYFALGEDVAGPTVTITCPREGDTYLQGQAVKAVWTAEDAGAGLDQTRTQASSESGGLIDTSSFGVHTFTVTAVDKAGNTTELERTYTVPFRSAGVEQPVDPNGASIFKLGRTVPLKFRLCDAAGAPVNDAQPRLTVSKVTSAVLGSDVEAVYTLVPTSDDLFRCEGDGRYVLNLGTKALTTGTYQVRIDLGRGALLTARFSLR
jgi:hypothetical protein